ncbi:hypothetical protein G6F31_021393 [Rhizopus arrhizus]|nr:hypothetical protein G6F31_021393 [Rhizopus arrhizus]
MVCTAQRDCRGRLRRRAVDHLSVAPRRAARGPVPAAGVGRHGHRHRRHALFRHGSRGVSGRQHLHGRRRRHLGRLAGHRGDGGHAQRAGHRAGGRRAGQPA